ncbi:ROK family protein [Actinospica sp.]|uniref:ROK family protein n=1 Tax=Actinospica sp. TaxID=1872142 RepID=UPI002D0113D6|nr:ROK family protein [Actinospica sp.]HWG22967.1 ROK family protein [Actinospica sp.]
MTEASPILAIDIGGTKLAAALVANGVVLRRAEIPTPAAPPSERHTVANTLIDLAEQVVADDRPRAIGLASAGPLDLAAGTVSPVNIPSWRDFPLRESVAAAFPGARTVLVGDAVAAAVGEHWRGAGSGTAAMLGIVVSTGVGGGLVLDGRVYSGPTGNAGHFGHIPTDGEPVRCVCGMTGCVEALASGPSMVRWAKRQGWRGGEPDLDARVLAQDAHAGDETALAAFDRAADALACGIVGAAALVDLDVVVIGGGVAAAGPVLIDPLRAHLKRRASLGFVQRIRALPGTLGRDAGLIGAARCALDG